MSETPHRSHTYIGPVTDTRIWDDFALRPDDIILSTPPKCGTTWSQAILMMVLQGAAVTDRPIWRDSLWLDAGFRNQQEAKATLEAETQRRCIKSHTPLDGLPYTPDITYLCVYRHPIDVHFSMMKHIANMTADILDYLCCDSPDSAFERFLTAPATSAGTDDLTLAAILHHYRSFAKWAHLPNLHFAHYADLSADLPLQIKRYGRIIGTPVTDDLAVEIAAAASFGAMKDLTRQRLDGTGIGAFTVASSFFDSASSNKWHGRLSDAQLTAYHARMKALATPQEIAFLEGGLSALDTLQQTD